MKKYTLLLAVLLIALPFIVDACPLCQGGGGYSQATLTSYKVITGFLASLPMVMGGGIFLWIKRKRKKLESTNYEDTLPEGHYSGQKIS